MEDNQVNKTVIKLERTLEQERAIRISIEDKLEYLARKLFDIEDKYVISQNKVAIQQEQLEFLTGLIAETWKQPSLQDIIAKYLERTHHFLPKAQNLFIEIHNDRSYHQFQYYAESFDKSDERDKSAESDKKIYTEHKYIVQHLNIEFIYNQINFEDELQIFEYSEITKTNQSEFKYCAVVPLYSLDLPSGKGIGIAILLYADSTDINILKLQTLESSRSMLSAIIERKHAEELLHERLLELESTNQVLEQTQQQLLQQEKLASLGQLAAGVAHEINNPIGFVLSNLDTMRDYLKDINNITSGLFNGNLSEQLKVETMLKQWQSLDGDFLFEDGKEILSSSVQGLERVKEIVSDLNTFSRMDNDELETIDLNVVIEKSLNVVSNEFKYSHQVKTDLLQTANILGNAGKLQQVFINLFVNARHAMPDGGTLFISSKRDRNKIVVCVKDQGHGIEQACIPDIFTPFYTTKAPGEGTGLGLAISYSILQQHNAKIEVSSEVGKGTEFKLGFYEAL
jgi:signal transduction histidine kinase